MKYKLTLFAALLFAPIASMRAADGFPSFSWERVPVYAHFGYDANLLPEQYDFPAKNFTLITFAAGRDREGVERGIE